MTDLLPPQGALDGVVHYFPIRVYYEDTDAGGIVYHAAYIKFAERARSEFMRVLGWTHGRLLDELGVFWEVRRLEADYRLPARLDEALVLASRLVSFKGASMTLAQTIRRGTDELVRLTLQLALLTTSGKPARLPPQLRHAFLPLLEVQESAADPCPSIR